MTTEPPPDLPSLTVDWLDALLDSASVDTIGVTGWWPRATAALATAAATADSYGHAVSVACHKLQIDVLSTESAKALAALEPQLEAHLAEWRTLAERDATYLVALTRLKRQGRTAARKEAKAAKAATSATPAGPAAKPEEAMF